MVFKILFLIRNEKTVDFKQKVKNFYPFKLSSLTHPFNDVSTRTKEEILYFLGTPPTNTRRTAMSLLLCSGIISVWFLFSFV